MDVRKLLLAIGAGIVIGGSALAAPKPAPVQKVEVINTVQTSEVAKPDPTTVPCDPPTDVRTSDLCAQWKAADAAERAADYTFWTLVIAVISLAVTVASVWFIWESLRATREQQRQEFRAYIEPIIETPTVLEGRLFMQVTLKNYGRTPATDITGSLRMEFKRVLPEDKDGVFASLGYNISKYVLHPGKPTPMLNTDGAIFNGDFIQNGSGAVTEGTPEYQVLMMMGIYQLRTALKFDFKDAFGRSHTETHEQAFATFRVDGEVKFKRLADLRSD